MSEKKKVLGFYGIMEFGDYLGGLRGGANTFQIEADDGQLMDCSLDEVIRRFRAFCSSDDEEKFRVRIGRLDSATGTRRYTEKVLRKAASPDGSPRRPGGFLSWFSLRKNRSAKGRPRIAAPSHRVVAEPG